MDVCDQLEPPTYEESVFVALRDLPICIGARRPKQGPLVVKLQTTGQSADYDRLRRNSLKTAFLAVWDIDRTRTSWLMHAQAGPVTVDIHKGKLCMTFLLSSQVLTTDAGWFTPWGHGSPSGNFPDEFLQTPVGRRVAVAPTWDPRWYDVQHPQADLAAAQRSTIYRTMLAQQTRERPGGWMADANMLAAAQAQHWHRQAEAERARDADRDEMRRRFHFNPLAIDG